MTSDIARKPSRQFAFGPFLLCPDRQLLAKDGVPVHIGSRSLDILTVLVERPGELVSKREIMTSVWPATVVEDENLKVNMVALRRALGDDAMSATYIATVTGRGYRFIAPVQTSEASSLAWTPFSTGNGNLPTEAPHIVGRSDAIARIRSDLNQTRILSIVGAGGIGKTTIAIAAARAEALKHADGAAFIDLSTISDTQFVGAAVSAALGLGVASGDPLSNVVSDLRHRHKVLLFDNCEHLLPAVASVVDRIAREVGGVSILTTSREPLRIRGERVHRLRGLDVDPSEHPTADQARQFPAVELFAVRASERSGYRLTDAEAPAVAEICRRLEGNALAIELAAIQTATCSAVRILQMLDDKFRLLRLTSPGAAPRQQSLFATLDWSYSLLPESEAVLLRASAVFAGAFSTHGASAVSNLSASEAADALVQLAGKSMLVIDSTGDMMTYRIPVATRAYCLERLQSSREADAVRARHADHVCEVLERATAEWQPSDLRFSGSNFRHWIDDLRAALAWAGRDEARRSLRIRLTAAGVLIWNHWSLTEECRRHVSEAVADLEAAGQTGTAVETHLQMSLAGNTLFARGLQPEVMDALRRALTIAAQIADTDAHLRCLRTIGACELLGGQHDAGTRTLESCAAVAAAAPAAEDTCARREWENYLAIGELFVGRLHSARQRLDRLSRRDEQDPSGSHQVRFLVYRNVDIGSVLSHTQWLTGSPETAERTAAATVDEALQTNYWFSVSNCISWACLIFFLTGRHDECHRHVDLLEEQVLRHGIGVRRPFVAFYRGALACAQAAGSVQGLDDLARGIEAFRATNFLARMPFYLGIQADAFARSGRLEEAEATIQDSIECAVTQNERWCVPELLRIRASILAARGLREKAEALLTSSMAMALELGALSWRLRAANDLAKLWLSKAKKTEAHKMLLSVHGEFTEGFATRDLSVATSLLAALEPSRQSPFPRAR